MSLLESARALRALALGSAALLALLLATPSPASALAGREHAFACPDGTLPGPKRDACFPVRDARDGRSGRRARELPSLGELRRAQRKRRGLVPLDSPVPGGIGIGTTYAAGELSALSHAELESTVFVHPGGIEPSNQNLEWLYSTATNRTEKSVEVVAGYHFDEPGWLGVFDWSCSAAYPCAGGKTTPSWIWSVWLSSRPENLFQVYDDAGHLQTAVRYLNRTVRIGTYSPPRWRNSVLLWNEDGQTWDLVYEHTYHVAQRDCSASNACGWWGPILEDFPVDGRQPYPEIRELGFQDTRLQHDGVLSELGPDETGFLPPVTPWILAHHDPNGAYGAGNVFDGPPPGGGSACGLGAELAITLPLLLSARRRRRPAQPWGGSRHSRT